LKLLGQVTVAASSVGSRVRAAPKRLATHVDDANEQGSGASDLVTLFLCGDIMTGRGIDQVLPHPGNPRIHEEIVKSAVRYVELAEARHGEIRKPVAFSRIWGEALDELERVAPAVKIVNLETAITRSEDYWRGKAIHYRMHPDNTPCLTAAGIDCCALANNHVLDWGYAGLDETLAVLKSAGIGTAGAGSNAQQAAAPTFLEVEGQGRIVVYSLGSVTSGIPHEWAATRDGPGVNLIADTSQRSVKSVAAKVHELKRSGDIVVASIHWGSNWGYKIPVDQQRFARTLIDDGGVDVVHGHSSHHVKGIEIYQGRPIIYGCGDFLTDYEGIEGYEEFRDDLGLMYFLTMSWSTGKLVRFGMTPTQLRRFRLSRASASDRRWLRDVLTREGREFSTWAEMASDNTLLLRWGQAANPG
jgi:poly-gamma-glutamate synthesis protein (capsule biosynthesis protein)